jgi:hypothetical protein
MNLNLKALIVIRPGFAHYNVIQRFIVILLNNFLQQGFIILKAYLMIIQRIQQKAEHEGARFLKPTVKINSGRERLKGVFKNG